MTVIARGSVDGSCASLLDIKGAADDVHRQLLWATVQHLGMHGRMLAAMISLYSAASTGLEIQGRLCSQGQASNRAAPCVQYVAEWPRAV